MIKQLKNNSAILNIFKDDIEFVEDFIRHHAPIVKDLIMLNTGNKETYNIAKKLAEEYTNISLFYQEYELVDFSQFRNDCLSFAKKQVECEYFIWIDTDERLDIIKEEKFDTDIVCINRQDSSNRFASYIDRIFKSNLEGHWVKNVHEHFALANIGITKSVAKGLQLIHLTSEAARPMEKKKLYYSLLSRQLADAEKIRHRQGKIDAIQHMILMASHDFRNPELCVQLYETHYPLIFSLNNNDGISNVQKLNILIHSLISFSRLEKIIPNGLVEEILKIDNSKSTYFQLMRAMIFNKQNKERIKYMYEVEYSTLEDTKSEFNNQDYLVEKEITWFEKKLYDK
jgi:signal transduction histidine kinase